MTFANALLITFVFTFFTTFFKFLFYCFSFVNMKQFNMWIVSKTLEMTAVAHAPCQEIPLVTRRIWNYETFVETNRKKYINSSSFLCKKNKKIPSKTFYRKIFTIYARDRVSTQTIYFFTYPDFNRMYQRGGGIFALPLHKSVWQHFIWHVPEDLHILASWPHENFVVHVRVVNSSPW